MKSSIKTLALTLGATFAFAAAVPAQQTQSPATGDSTAQGERQERRGGRRNGKRARRHNGSGISRRAFANLNLTDAQKDQMRTIATQTKLATRAQREELFRIREAKMPGVKLSAEQQARRQQLRGELRAARQQARTQMLAVLTTEQRTQLEQQKQERQRRHAERRARFGGAQQTS